MTAPNWYMVNKDGMATLCTDKEGAEQEAADAQMAWPHMGPHRAVQLVEAADVEAMRAALAKPQTAPQQEAREPAGWNSLTDEDRERAMNSMPGMLEGFMKTWGWLHFAKAIEAICREKNAQPSPAAQGDALPREEFAWLVVREACETEPADEDDPECIRILRRDLKSSVLAAFLRHDAARAAQESK